MQCFLGLEVWHFPGEAFLVQDNYVVKIFKRFQMMDYKSLTIPMIPNMKLFAYLNPNLVDPSMYGQW